MKAQYFKAQLTRDPIIKNQNLWIRQEYDRLIIVYYRFRKRGRYIAALLAKDDPLVGPIKEKEVTEIFFNQIKGKNEMIKPRANVTRSEARKPAYKAFYEPQFEIAAFCEGEDNDPSQVHFIIHWPLDFSELPPMAIRFKSPDTLGFFIEEMTNYRRIVFPDCEPVTGEITPGAIIAAIVEQENIEPTTEIEAIIQRLNDFEDPDPA